MTMQRLVLDCFDMIHRVPGIIFESSMPAHFMDATIDPPVQGEVRINGRKIWHCKNAHYNPDTDQWAVEWEDLANEEGLPRWVSNEDRLFDQTIDYSRRTQFPAIYRGRWPGTWAQDVEYNFFGITIKKVGHKIYVFGTHTDSGYDNTIYSFDMFGGAWTTCASVPMQLKGSSICLFSDGKFYIARRTDQFSNHEFAVFNPADNSVTYTSDENATANEVKHYGAVTDGTYIYCRDEINGELIKYTPGGTSFTSVADPYVLGSQFGMTWWDQLTPLSFDESRGVLLVSAIDYSGEEVHILEYDPSIDTFDLVNTYLESGGPAATNQMLTWDRYVGPAALLNVADASYPAYFFMNNVYADDKDGASFSVDPSELINKGVGDVGPAIFVRDELFDFANLPQYTNVDTALISGHAIGDGLFLIAGKAAASDIFVIYDTSLFFDRVPVIRL